MNSHLLHIMRLFIYRDVGGGHRVALLVFGGGEDAMYSWRQVLIYSMDRRKAVGWGRGTRDRPHRGTHKSEWRSGLSIKSAPPLSRGQSASSHHAPTQQAQLRPTATKYTGRLNGWQDNKLHISTSSHLDSAQRPVHLGHKNRAR